MTLTNIPRVGIGFKNGSKGKVTGCTLTGNYPVGQWTGVETVHFGIGVDPGGGTTDGLITMTGNLIESCVQGCFVGNYGTGAGRGITFTANTVNRCWNHGIYCATGSGHTVTGNTFANCQIPVVVTGKAHTVTGNAMFTNDTGNETDVAGISVRDAEGCVVTGNTLMGDAPSASVIIDVREFTGTTCTDNIVAHNTVKVTGGSSYAIRIGGGSATTFYNNKVQGNVVRSVGRENAGVIGVVGNSGTQGYGNSVLDNDVTMLGNSNGIYITQCVDTRVAGNYIRLGFDSGGAVTLGGVFLTGAATRTQIRHNTFIVPAAWGTNVTFRAVYENSGVSVAGSIVTGNTFDLSAAKATVVMHLIQSGSGAFIDERGTGAPSMAALIGSRWARTDGGAGTSLYVKESGTDSTGWVGK
jgi:hypothetical protein